jgi:type 1 fimbria pilin
MHGARWLVLVGCSVAMVFASPAVRAGGGGTIEGGTITFVGAVVEPTCSVLSAPGDMNQVLSAAQAHPSVQRSCSNATAAAAATNVSRPYELDVVHLSGAEPDRVLNYFANYVRTAQPASADPVLVTQTYE